MKSTNNGKVDLNRKSSVQSGGKDDDGYDIERHAGYGWLLFCATGMVSTLAIYGVVLEYATSGNRKLHELSFVFVTTTVYTVTAYIARWIFGEKPTDISKYQMLLLSTTSIASTFTSIRSLRYVIYPVQVLFKSCKPVPVMIFGILLGKRYPVKKYVNVMIITTGVALFMSGGKSSSKTGSGSESALLGAFMLSISLCFDGATGAYEDKLMGNDHAGPFDLMYNIQLGKAIISFCTLVVLNQLPMFLDTIHNSGYQLILLGLSGAMGQVFVFVTIAKFGALNCALIGLGRKILSLFLSFVLYGHSMNATQTVGLALAVISMIANFYEKGGGGNKKHSTGEDQGTAGNDEQFPLMDDIYDHEEGERRETSMSSPLSVSSLNRKPSRIEPSTDLSHAPTGAISNHDQDSLPAPMDINSFIEMSEDTDTTVPTRTPPLLDLFANQSQIQNRDLHEQQLAPTGLLLFDVERTYYSQRVNPFETSSSATNSNDIDSLLFAPSEDRANRRQDNSLLTRPIDSGMGTVGNTNDCSHIRIDGLGSNSNLDFSV